MHTNLHNKIATTNILQNSQW